MAVFRILSLNQISERGLAYLPETNFRIAADIERPDAILLRSADLHHFSIPDSVVAVARAGAGTNNIPVAALSARGIPVFNAPGANANAVKELVLAAVLIAARNLVPALHYVALLDKSNGLDEQVEAGKKQFAGVELPGRSLGIVGLGAIGSLVADTALKLGMRVIGFDPQITVDAAWRLPASVVKANRLEDLVRQSDFITLHVPLIDATRKLVDARMLGLMKPGAVLLNFSREGIVDNAAAIAALRTRQLKSYLCDFPSAELIGESGVVALPHLGASTEEAEENCATMVAQQLREFLQQGSIRNAVNFPDVDMARESPHRLAIANSNVPNMLGQISTALASAGLNIHNMVNKSRADLAYTLVDVDSPVSAAVLASLSAIDGVLSVRLIHD